MLNSDDHNKLGAALKEVRDILNATDAKKSDKLMSRARKLCGSLRCALDDVLCRDFTHCDGTQVYYGPRA